MHGLSGDQVQSSSVCNHTSDEPESRESDLFQHEYVSDRIGRHEVMLPINRIYKKLKGEKNRKRFNKKKTVLTAKCV